MGPRPQANVLLTRLGILQQLANGHVSKDLEEPFRLAGKRLGVDIVKLRSKGKISYLVVLLCLFHSRTVRFTPLLESGSVIMVQYAASVHP
jgi:hypothetical protein